MDTLDGLNEEQRRAVTHGEGPLLIVAGAGTGKTTVITRRIAWLIEQKKCKPEEILALTFTDKAATEMEERVDRILPYGYVNLWISTFHSFCEKILKAHALDIGLANDFTLLDTTASWLLVRKNLDRFALDYYRPLGNPTKFIHALLKHFSRCKDEAITPEQYLGYAQGLQLNADSTPEVGDEQKKTTELANAYHVYQQLLLEKGAMDFGDLILSTLQLFRMRPAILARYQRSFPFVLVDEFQDTNIAQYNLVKLIAMPGNNLTVVGDDDQAIFRWRGASFHNIISFKKDFPESKEIVLTNNYRSPQNILDMAYAFIQQNNPQRLEYQLQEQGKSLSKRLFSSDPLPGVIEHIHCATQEDEVTQVLGSIRKLKEENQEGSWGDYAILVRSNDTASPFLAGMDEIGIPYHFLALKGLYTKPIIMDIVSFLKVLENPHDSPAVYRVLTWPHWDISHAGLVELSHHAHKKGKTLWSVLLTVETVPELSEETREKMTRVRGLVENLGAKARHARASELFLTVLKDTGLLASVSGDTSASDRENLALLNELFSKVKTFQQSEPSGRLADFMALLRFEQESGDEGSLARLSDLDPDSVKVMTIHGSKGLEFPYVFLVSMIDQRFPTRERGDAIPLPGEIVSGIIFLKMIPDTISPTISAHLEEERRLMYVALTRAKRGMYFSSALDYGGNRMRKSSQFLYELGLVSLGDTTTTTKRLNHHTDEIIVRPENQTRAMQPLPLPRSFSFSQIAAFRSCPLQYKFSFLLKIPTFGKPSLSFGKSIHATLQKFIESVLARARKEQGNLFSTEELGYTTSSTSLPSLEELLELYKESWSDDWYPSRKLHDEYFEKGTKMLTSFYREFSILAPKPNAVERDFVVKIDSYTLKGRIDRIDTLPDGSIEIIDYKTGKSKDEESFGFSDKEQLLLYQVASEEVLGQKVSRLTYYYLEDGKRISFFGSDKEKQKVLEKMTATLDAMKNSTFEATPGWHCQFCDFRDICEYRQ